MQKGKKVIQDGDKGVGASAMVTVESE